MDYNQAMEYLNSAPAFTDIDTQNRDLAALLAHLGNPHERIKAIHVAGTNGKGSVCAFIDSILRTKGHRVGLFTSPYLVRFNDRIRINNEAMSDAHLIAYTEKIKQATLQVPVQMCRFAFITAIMFLYFADQAVDYAVIEVGLGGLNDATHFCHPVVSVITSISKDHTAILGKTLHEIARQKAGIIKSGVPIVSVRQRLDVMRVIGDTARQKNAPLTITAKPRGVRAMADGTEFIYRGVPYKTSLCGAYQSNNAAAALEAAGCLGIKLDASVQAAVMQTRWEGRLQVICNQPFVLVDGAHNPDAARKLAGYLKTMKGRKIFITGMADDKDVDTCVKTFAKLAHSVYTVGIDSPRSMQPEKLLELYKRAGVGGEAFANVKQALQAALAVHAQDKIIICGSLYLVGEVLKYIQDKEISLENR